MRIHSKIVWVVLPLIIVPFILLGVTASLAARNGITKIATDFLLFKSEQLLSYANTQWNILTENNLSAKPEFVKATKEAVASYASNLIRSPSEIIFALDKSGNMAMSTGDFSFNENEKKNLMDLRTEKKTGWIQFVINGKIFVGEAAFFKPFDWYILAAERRDVFYRAVNEIYIQSGVILISATVISIILLFVISGFLTSPMKLVINAMRDIILKNDLSRRVPIVYADEIGELGHTFNIMTEELEKAYNQIKSYAFRSVVARKREEKIRHIFQRYVPKDVIDQFFEKPESMLVGDNRELAVLFSDIRQFTSISEKLPPDEVVESLNKYFSLMVDIVMQNSGIVDKFIGDALMAFYGAPVKHDDDAERSVKSALEMLAVLEKFNAWQKTKGHREFRIGIGINYGKVTVGNIGSEKKMDYTVVGDMVNLASRLEELTKEYKEPLIISETVEEQLNDDYKSRLLDRVRVVGKTEAINIYTVRDSLTEKEIEGWKLHYTAMKLYFTKNFSEAARIFRDVANYIPNDRLSNSMIARCSNYIK
ncbi:MAG: HAMP domain-containing protein, partial [Spirochaetales bacterium]|nr:HAMP domain-containing protein [Spirochaetales bacterium]